jgi:hypothetical protein
MHDVLARLSSEALSALAVELREGALRSGVSNHVVQQIVGQSEAESTSEVLRDLAARGWRLDQVATLLDVAASMRAEAVEPESILDLVLSGPEIEGAPTRDTMAVMQSLIADAKREVILVGYAIHNGKQLFAPLARRMEASPGLDVWFCLNIERGSGDQSSETDVVRRFLERFHEENWPWDRKPAIYYDPRSLENGPTRSSLHAKCLICDRMQALISSANFTEAAQERNIEAGVLVRHASSVARLARHFDSLRACGALREGQRQSRAEYVPSPRDDLQAEPGAEKARTEGASQLGWAAVTPVLAEKPYKPLLDHLGSDPRRWQGMKGASVVHLSPANGEGLISQVLPRRAGEPGGLLLRLRYRNGRILELTPEELVAEHCYVEVPGPILAAAFGGVNPGTPPLSRGSGPELATGQTAQRAPTTLADEESSGAQTARPGAKAGLVQATDAGHGTMPAPLGPQDHIVGTRSAVKGATSQKAASDVQRPKVAPEEAADVWHRAEARRTAGIAEVIKERCIKQLVHFTWYSNLPSIMERGLLPRDQAERLSPRPTFADDKRLDRRPSALSLSITEPNTVMLNAKCSSAPTELRKWVILAIQPSVLYTHDCSFFPRNAACKEYDLGESRFDRLEPHEVIFAKADWRCGRHAAAALGGMFADEVGEGSRGGLGLEPNQTTDPQAEVMVRDAIAPELIMRVIVYNDRVAEWVRGFSGDLQVEVSPSAYARRRDSLPGHTNWRPGRGGHG